MMSRYARRLAGMVTTLAIVSAVTYVLLAAAPGDAASAAVGETASSEQLEMVRVQMGLDQPLPLRYLSFLANLVGRGDLGRSLITHRPVSELVLERLPYTFSLALVSMTLAAGLGALLGMTAALRSGTLAETLMMGGAALALAVPTFWSALLFILLFSLRLRWLPVVGAEGWQHFILPSIALALPTVGVVARLMRASLLDVCRADYVRTAHAKGISPRAVLLRHMVRNSLIPVVTVFGLHLGHLLGGAFVVETIFGFPGLGRLMVQAIFDRDYPVVMGTALIIAVIYLLINLMVDLVDAWLDPQIAHSSI